MKSLLFGKRGQRRETEGNVSFGLITQRSKVQILPPQRGLFSELHRYLPSLHPQMLTFLPGSMKPMQLPGNRNAVPGLPIWNSASILMTLSVAAMRRADFRDLDISHRPAQRSCSDSQGMNVFSADRRIRINCEVRSPGLAVPIARSNTSPGNCRNRTLNCAASFEGQ